MRSHSLRWKVCLSDGSDPVIQLNPWGNGPDHNEEMALKHFLLLAL